MRRLSPRRWPPVVWILAPLAIGLLYALVHALLAPSPTLADLPPSDAILVQRFRNLEALDRASFGARGDGVRPARELIAAARNVRGLPGVEPTGPVHMILMPRTGRPDSTMAVFRVEDAQRFESEFERSDFLERDLVRHAQHMVRRGAWIAVAPNRDDARRIGTGGITAADLGEDQAIAADLPRLIDHALSLARQYPWRSILEALGVKVDALYTRVDEATGRPMPVLAGDDRLQRIRDTWAQGRLWSWFEPGRVRVELTPQPGALADALQAAFAEVAALDARPGSAPHPPADAELWIRAADRRAAGLAFRLMHVGGVPLFPQSESDISARLAALDGDGPEGLLAWAVPARGGDDELVFGLASHAPAAFLDTVVGLVPEGEVARSPESPGLSILARGSGARGAIESLRSSLAAGLRPTEDPGFRTYSDEDFRVLATFGMTFGRATRVLGRALKPGGFLAPLDRGDLHGMLTTDGRVVRLEAWVTR